MNNNSKFSSVVDFINQVEASQAFQDPLETTTNLMRSQYESDPIVLSIKEEVGNIILRNIGMNI